MDEQALGQIEKIIGYEFSSPALLSTAFTHSSSVDDRLSSNERLEFLGDAILGAVVCEDLYNRFLDRSEGELTTMKSMLVSRQSCAEVAKQLGLQGFLKTGKGMNSYGQGLPDSLIAGLLEDRVRVPEDLKLVLFRNHEIDVFCPFPASLVESSVLDTARALVKQIDRQFRGERCERIVLPHRLVPMGEA